MRIERYLVRPGLGMGVERRLHWCIGPVVVGNGHHVRPVVANGRCVLRTNDNSMAVSVCPRDLRSLVDSDDEAPQIGGLDRGLGNSGIAARAERNPA